MPSDLYNNEAEQYTIAAILRNPEEYFAVNDIDLSYGDFVNRDHSNIFAAIESAVERKSDPTLPFVVEYLRESGHDDAVDYVGDLMSVPSSVSQAHDYARVIKGLSVGRALGKVGARIIDIAQERRSDYNSAIVDAEKALRRVALSLPQQERSPIASDILVRMSSSTEADKVPLRFSTTLQSLTGGLSRGHFWVVGAFSSTGKSAFAANLALDALRAGKKVAIISAEMTQEQYLLRLLAIDSDVPLMEIASRVTIGLDKQQRLVDAQSRISGYPLYIYDTLTRLPDIQTELQRLKHFSGLDVLILDYIQNVHDTGNEVDDARTVAMACQNIAKELDCVVVACSQLSNAQAQYEIQGGDENYYSLKGHGSIRDAADVVLTLHRDRARQSSVLKVKMRKNRHGPISDFSCHFNLATSAIEEIDWENDDDA